MYVIEPNEEVGKVYLKVRDLRTRAYSSLEEFCQSHILDECERELGPYLGAPILQPARREWRWRDRRCVDTPAHTKGAEWVLSKADGESILIEEVRNAYHEWWARRREEYRPTMGRKANGGWGGWRSPRTANEKRQAFHLEEEGEPPVRPSRRAHMLPDAWDDIHRYGICNWKWQTKRKKQYRPK